MDHPLVLFDGVCVFCNRSVNFVIAHDPAGRFRFAPLQSNLGQSLLDRFNLRARYDWAFGDYKPFAWIGASHVGPQSNEPASFPSGNDPSQNPPTTTLLRYDIPGYTTYDAALGIAKDNWTAQITGSKFRGNKTIPLAGDGHVS